LDRARWLGARMLIVSAGVVGEWNAPRPAARYEDALFRAHAALRTLALEAEARNVMLAVENGFERFLLSPVEMRELIDHVNSGWVRVGLNVGNALAFGYPQDWIDTLGSRIVCVHARDYRVAAGTPAGLCAPGDGDVEWPAVVAALRRMYFDGPVIDPGPGEPADMSRRLDRVLAG
jgi:L-ribulose-5-phosphate 3-epimerase